MTNDSHTVTMERVTVASLKARLSEYLRRVEGGEPIIVVRHGTPVARLERVTGPQVQVRPPRKRTGAWWTVKGPAVVLDRDVVDYLLDERADRGPIETGSVEAAPEEAAERACRDGRARRDERTPGRRRA